MKRAVVLADGGVAGIAWELGVLHGWQDADPDLADRVIAADRLQPNRLVSGHARTATGFSFRRRGRGGPGGWQRRS